MTLKDKKYLAAGILTVVVMVFLRLIAGVYLAYQWNFEESLKDALWNYGIIYLLSFLAGVWAVRTLMRKDIYDR